MIINDLGYIDDVDDNDGGGVNHYDSGRHNQNQYQR